MMSIRMAFGCRGLFSMGHAVLSYTRQVTMMISNSRHAFKERFPKGWNSWTHCVP